MKRSALTLSLSTCIIYQETKKDTFFNAIQQRPALLKESSEEQRKLGDTNNTDVTDAILEAIEAKQS